jgi:uncharacterized membrane protein
MVLKFYIIISSILLSSNEKTQNYKVVDLIEEKTQNYKVVDLIEDVKIYNFIVLSFFIWGR